MNGSSRKFDKMVANMARVKSDRAHQREGFASERPKSTLHLGKVASRPAVIKFDAMVKAPEAVKRISVIDRYKLHSHVIDQQKDN